MYISHNIPSPDRSANVWGARSITLVLSPNANHLFYLHEFRKLR